jgi:hypothetical protein
MTQALGRPGCCPLAAIPRGGCPRRSTLRANWCSGSSRRSAPSTPLGAARCAERLAARLNRDDLLPADIEALAEAGHLTVVEVFHARKGGSCDLFALAAVDAVIAGQVDAVVTGRTGRSSW